MRRLLVELRTIWLYLGSTNLFGHFIFSRWHQLTAPSSNGTVNTAAVSRFSGCIYVVVVITVFPHPVQVCADDHEHPNTSWLSYDDPNSDGDFCQLLESL